MRTIWLSTNFFKYVSCKSTSTALIEVLKVACLILATVSLLYFINGAVTQITNDCQSAKFVQNLCQMRKAKMVEGSACSLICDARSVVDLCSSPMLLHAMKHHVMVRVCSDVCQIFAMSDEFYQSILMYTAGNRTKRDVKWIGDDTRRLYKTSSRILNSFLNNDHRDHEILLNSIPSAAIRPMTSSFIQGFLSLVSDKRFITHLLFAGNGESIDGMPYTDTDAVPYVRMDTTCGGMYLTQSLENYTLSVSDIINTTKDGWFTHHKIHPFYVYQIVLKLLELEEVTTEHFSEGEFYRCHVNYSQIFVDNWCKHSNPSLKFLLRHECTIKALDISSMLISKDALSREMSEMACTADDECSYGACQGSCSDARCLPPRTPIDSLIDICQAIKKLESRLLTPIINTEVENNTGSGALFTYIDRCINMAVLTRDKTESDAILLYNTVFQGLKQHLVYKFQEIQYAIQHAAGE